jgi:hypothetical protein
MQELVVRPRVGGLLWRILGALAFVAAGAWMISTGEIFPMLAGVVSIAFFGGGMALVVAQSVQHGVSQLTVGPDGLRSRFGVISWADVESVRFDARNGGVVGIRLHDPKRFMASVPPTTNQATRRFMLPFAFVLGAFDHRLRSYARSVRTFADEVRWTRETSGWDLGFPAAFLDRPGGEFAELLERYRHAA